MLVASNELLGVCNRLAAVDALTSEHVHDVVTGLSICNNTRFKEMCSQLARNSHLGNVDILATIRPNDPPETQIDEILKKAVSICDMLCKTRTWNMVKKGEGGHTAFNANTGPEYN